MPKNRSIIDDIEVNGKEVRFEFALPFTWEEVMQAAHLLNAKAVEQIEAFKKNQEVQEVQETQEVEKTP